MLGYSDKCQWSERCKDAKNGRDPPSAAHNPSANSAPTALFSVSETHLTISKSKYRPTSFEVSRGLHRKSLTKSCRVKHSAQSYVYRELRTSGHCHTKRMFAECDETSVFSDSIFEKSRSDLTRHHRFSPRFSHLHSQSTLHGAFHHNSTPPHTVPSSLPSKRRHCKTAMVTRGCPEMVQSAHKIHSTGQGTGMVQNFGRFPWWACAEDRERFPCSAGGEGRERFPYGTKEEEHNVKRMLKDSRQVKNEPANQVRYIDILYFSLEVDDALPQGFAESFRRLERVLEPAAERQVRIVDVPVALQRQVPVVQMVQNNRWGPTGPDRIVGGTCVATPRTNMSVVLDRCAHSNLREDDSRRESTTNLAPSCLFGDAHTSSQVPQELHRKHGCLLK